MTYTFENDALLILDSNRGIYAPRDFSLEIVRDYVSGVSKEDWQTLEDGPDSEWYWEAWEDVLNNARVTDPETGVVYTVHQDGDVWLVPEGCEIPEF